MLFFNFVYSIRLIHNYDSAEGCEPLKRKQIIFQTDYEEGSYKIVNVVTGYEFSPNSICILFPDLIQMYIENGLNVEEKFKYEIVDSYGDAFIVFYKNTGPSKIEDGILSNKPDALEILKQIGLF